MIMSETNKENRCRALHSLPHEDHIFRTIIFLWTTWMALGWMRMMNTPAVRWSVTVFGGLMAVYIWMVIASKYPIRYPRMLRTLLWSMAVLMGSSVLWAEDWQYSLGRYGAFLLMLLWSTYAIPVFYEQGLLRLETLYHALLWEFSIILVLVLCFGGEPFSCLLSSSRYDCGNTLKATGVAECMLQAIIFITYAAAKDSAYRRRWIFLAMLCCCVVLLLASKGRAGIVTLVLISPLLMQIFGYSHHKSLWYIILLGAGVGFFIPEEFWVQTLRLNSDDITTNRLEMFMVLWDEGLARHPILGAGTGMDRIFLGNYAWLSTSQETSNACNQFITVFFNWGFVGVAIFYSFYAYVGMCAYKLWKATWHPQYRLLLVFITWFAAIAIETNGSGGMDTAGNPSCYLFWMFGCIIAIAVNRLKILQSEKAKV